MTDIEVFQAGELDPATARVFAAQWREAQRLAVTSVIPRTITHRRENVNGSWQDVPQPDAVVKATVFAVVRYGAEVFGFPGPTALARIDVIEGRLEPRYDALLGLMLDAGHQVRTREMSDERATVAVRRREDVGDPEGWQTFSFTIAEAKAAGYVKDKPSDRDLRGAWYLRRADMLMSKAVRRAFRLAGADALVQHGTVDLVDGAPVEAIVGPARSAGLSIEAAASDRDDEPVDGELVDEALLSHPGGTTEEEAGERRAKLQRQVMATATKAFPRKDGLPPAAQRARMTALRHAATYVALKQFKSANDMDVDELTLVLTRLEDIVAGRLRIDEREPGVFVAVQGDRELPIPAETEAEAAA